MTGEGGRLATVFLYHHGSQEDGLIEIVQLLDGKNREGLPTPEAAPLMPSTPLGAFGSVTRSTEHEDHANTDATPFSSNSENSFLQPNRKDAFEFAMCKGLMF